MLLLVGDGVELFSNGSVPGKWFSSHAMRRHVREKEEFRYFLAFLPKLFMYNLIMVDDGG